MDLDGAARRADTSPMKTYGQYCPIARAAEVFAERWTPIIVRNLHLGCQTFTAIQQEAPGIPKSLLAAPMLSATLAVPWIRMTSGVGAASETTPSSTA